MFHQKFRAHRQRRKQIAKEVEDEENKKNKPITIRDIHVVPADSKSQFGDYNRLTLIHDPVDRLAEHIQYLGDLADFHHYKYYEDQDTHQTKPEFLNHITRLITNEFHFYTNNPLTIEEYKALLIRIRKSAKDWKPNVHLLLNGIAVLDEKGVFHHKVLHVRGGINGDVVEFDKPISDKKKRMKIRPDYWDQLPENDVNRASQQDGNLQDMMLCDTEGGAQFVQAVDVCDVRGSQPMKERMIAQCREKTTSFDETFPQQIDHYVSSKQLPGPVSSLSQHRAEYVDPLKAKRKYEKITEDFVKVLNEEPRQYYFEKQPYGYMMTGNKFGPTCKIIVQKERQLDRFKRSIQNEIDDMNLRICKSKVSDQFSEDDNAKYDDAKQKLDRASLSIRLELDALNKKLLKQCECGFFEALFRKKSYKVKKAAKVKIAECLEDLSKLSCEDEGCFITVRSRLGKLNWDLWPSNNIDNMDDCTVQMLDIIDAATKHIAGVGFKYSKHTI